MASTGHTWMHLVQPMQSASTMRASVRGFSTPWVGSSASTGVSSNAASLAMPAAPPGGQRLIGASPRAIASAYGRQPWKPHCSHCVCGNRSEEHTSELQSRRDLVCRLLLEKKKTIIAPDKTITNNNHI